MRTIPFAPRGPQALLNCVNKPKEMEKNEAKVHWKIVRHRSWHSICSQPSVLVCVCAWITVNCISNIRNIHLHWPRPLRTHKAHSDCLFMIKNSICSVLRKLVSVFIVVAAIIVAVTIVPVVVIIVIVIVERFIVDAARTR